MNWREKAEVKKGNICEDLIFDFLNKKGWRIYTPKSEGNHLIDFFAARTEKGVEVFFADAKGKARRTYKPDTGINVSHYNKYIELREKTKSQVFLFFIDETPGIESIYGNWLFILKDHGKINDNIIYFPLSEMRHICLIPDEIAEDLREKSKPTRNYPYWKPKTDEDYELIYFLRGESIQP